MCTHFCDNLAWYYEVVLWECWTGQLLVIILLFFCKQKELFCVVLSQQRAEIVR